MEGEGSEAMMVRRRASRQNMVRGEGRETRWRREVVVRRVVNCEGGVQI